MSKDTKSLITERISDSENISSPLFIITPVCNILQSITNCIKQDRHSGYVQHRVYFIAIQCVANVGTINQSWFYLDNLEL